MSRKIEISNFLNMTPQVPQYSDRNQNYLISGANPLYYLDEGGQEEQAAPLAASIDWAQITPSLNSSDTVQNSGVTMYYSGATTAGYAQSFHNTTAGIWGGVKVYLKKVEGTPGTLDATTITAQLFAHTGVFGTSSKPTGSALATTTAKHGTDVTGSYVLLTFNPTTSYTLASNTDYVVTIVLGSGGNASNYFLLGTDTTLSAAGNASSTVDGSTWVVDSTQDMSFLLYSGGVTPVILDGNIVHMITSTNSTYDVIAITDTTKVYGLTDTTVTDLGYPSGVSVSNIGGYLAIGSEYIFTTWGSATTVYKYPLAGGAWTTLGTITGSTGTHIMEPFLDFIAIRDGSGTFLTGGLVRKIDVSAFTISTGIDLGTGWGVMQMRNLNNKYLAIAGGKTSVGGSSSGFSQNYIFLWDGISTRYNYSVKIPGQFIDMRVVDSVLYVAVQASSGKSSVYYLAGTRLRKVFTTQLGKIAGSMRPDIACSLFDFRNFLGVKLNSATSPTYSLVIYGKDDAGNVEFVHSSGRAFDQFAVGYDGDLMANLYVSGDVSVLYWLPPSGTYQQILYTSQWIPVKNLRAIDVYYDTPPQTGTDAINVTIYGRGENIISGSSTTVLTSITPATYLNNERTRLDVQGFAGDKLKIQLTTVNTGSWRPIIRAIVPITA